MKAAVARVVVAWGHGGGYGSCYMLDRGDPAPDFKVGESTLHRMLEDRAVAVFFFPKAFTPG